jgi:hypothetical protein
MTRWIRRTLRRFNIDVPFRGVVCPEEARTISIDPQWRATTTIRRQMVFLSRPDAGDLIDIVPFDPGAGSATRLLESPDSTDIGHRTMGKHTGIYWTPREPIVKYAIYTHERSWMAPAGDVRDVLCTELVCRHKVSSMTIEILAPATYQAAVAFKRPRWHWLATERRLMKYALAQLAVGRQRPLIRDAGTRVAWKVSSPRVGERFVCIALTASGLAAWQQELTDTSLASRLRRLVRLRDRGAAQAVPGRVLF